MNSPCLFLLLDEEFIIWMALLVVAATLRNRVKVRVAIVLTHDDSIYVICGKIHVYVITRGRNLA